MHIKQEDSVPRYILNFDELLQYLNDELTKFIMKSLKEKYPQITTNNIEDLLSEIKSLLPHVQYKTTIKIIGDLTQNSGSILYGTQKIKGKLLDVPPIIKENKVEFKFDKDVYLTSLHFNQTGWKKDDLYSLLVDSRILIDDSFTKEVGEHKYFNKYYLVPAKTPIIFNLNNKSGNSRQVIVDLEYIEKGDPPLPPPPPPLPHVPGVDDIPNEWDVAVVMNWESNSPADIDLHGFIDNKHVYYANTTETDFYLNFDFTSHLNNANPEILSVKGYHDKILKIYVHNFNHVTLHEPIHIKIYGKGSDGNTILKEYDINLEASNTYLYGVCAIDLGNLYINSLHDKKRFR